MNLEDAIKKRRAARSFPYKQYGGRFGLDRVCYRETYGNSL